MSAKLASGFWVDVYRHPGRDCTLNGISSKYETLFVMEVPGDLPPAIPKDRVVVIEETVPGYKVLVPLVKPDIKGPGPMAGGHYAMNSSGTHPKYDRKFFPIHDRFETWELYNLLST
jgi:hypothetical protein